MRLRKQLPTNGVWANQLNECHTSAICVVCPAIVKSNELVYRHGWGTKPSPVDDSINTESENIFTRNLSAGILNTIFAYPVRT